MTIVIAILAAGGLVWLITAAVKVACRIIAAWNRASALIADAPDVNDDIGTAGGEADERLIALQDALNKACPWCNPASRCTDPGECNCGAKCTDVPSCRGARYAWRCPVCDKGISSASCECLNWCDTPGCTGARTVLR